MKKCTNCGYSSQEGNFCPSCGGSMYEVAPEEPVIVPNGPGAQEPYPSFRDPEVSVGQWLLTFLLMLIPCVNLILLFVWGFGSDAAPSKANWAKAQLIWCLIMIVISLLLSVIFAALGVSLFGMY